MYLKAATVVGDEFIDAYRLGNGHVDSRQHRLAPLRALQQGRHIVLLGRSIQDTPQHHPMSYLFNDSKFSTPLGLELGEIGCGPVNVSK